MERPHGVVFALIEVIEIPAVALVMLLDHRKILLHARLVVRQAADDEAHVHQHAEERPVVLGHVVVVDLLEPAIEVPLRLLRQGEEEFLRRQRHAHAEDRHLHQPLIVVLDLAPILGMVGIDAVDDARFPFLPDRQNALAAAGEHRNDRPERAGKRLHLGDVLVVHRAGIAQIQPRAPLAEQRHKRLDQLNCRAFDVRARAQRIMLYTVAHVLISLRS